MSNGVRVPITIVLLFTIFNVNPEYINEAIGNDTNVYTKKNPVINEHVSFDVLNNGQTAKYEFKKKILNKSMDATDPNIYINPINYNVAKYITRMGPEQFFKEKKPKSGIENFNGNDNGFVVDSIGNSELFTLQNGDSEIKNIPNISTNSTEKNTEFLPILNKLQYIAAIDPINYTENFETMAQLYDVSSSKIENVQILNVSSKEGSTYQLELVKGDLYKSIANMSDLLRTTMPRLISGIQDVHNNINLLSQNGTLWDSIATEYSNINAIFIICSSLVGLIIVLFLGLYALLKRICKR